MKRAILVLSTLVVFSGAVLAQNKAAVPDDGQCSGVVVFGEDSPVRLMRVTGGLNRVNFYESRSDKKKQCPAEVDSCQRKGFVVPGDEVLAGPRRGDFVCVSYVSPNAKKVKGQFAETAGFLPASQLLEPSTALPKAEAWLGKWSRSAEGEITISAGAGGKLKIDGEALWGSLDPGRVARGGVNSGVLEGETAPKGTMLALGENYDGTKPLGDDRSDCRARLRLLGRYLAVEDNGGCGGNNVSFTGLYVRLK
jgi:hypothetical protein